jgi:hypothetical protein
MTQDQKAKARQQRRDTHQLLLNRLLDQVAPGDRHTDRGALERLLLAIANVLYRQDLTFSTYVLLQATHDAGKPITLAHLARDVGFSYHATRNQIIRTPWFQTHDPNPLVTVSLNPDGQAKLARVTACLHQHLGTT